MAQVRKYANLPDLDSAPDIYETPDLIEDTSTVPASTTAQSPSSTSSAYSDASDNDQTGITRRHLQTDQARTRFQPARVDARDVDFSDRISHHQRQSYRTSSRRRRRHGTIGGDEFGDPSDEEDEGLDRKLARLRREVSEVKSEYERKRAESNNGAELEEEDPTAPIMQLSNMLDAIYVERHHGGVKGAEAQLSRTIKRFSKAAIPTQSSDSRSAPQIEVMAPFTQAPPVQLTHVLTKAAEFDSRLSFLEKSLGLNETNMPDIADNPPKPILYSLENLEQMMSIVSEASTSSLDAASQSVRKLIQEAEHLHEVRKSTQGAEGGSKRGTLSNDDTTDSEDTERLSKIKALYGTLATIDGLSPTLPLVLDRLRSLRLIHATAASAHTMLEEVEKRQADQESEIKKWKDMIEVVEASLQKGEGIMTGNVKVVGDWVRDLEARITKLT
ncbi:hypothetical protein K432DRAFT_442690 [Lepidopterella palustris CBS 459.81]|uniref:Dynactin subunit n=1 Tax=Lepidopterella palustris CBS 459.81 TaxID=1314670 RepID=A0A8E2EBP0_9PEZI|nr:hypothetical protein K432DRAFT_442690 [Lepidopterella palustris CBS 459.81]